MEQESKIDIYKILSNNEEITEKEILTLLVLMKKGKISNPELMDELNLTGADLKSSGSAGNYRKKLEKMGVIEHYSAKINWSKIGYPTSFFVVLTSYKKETLIEIERVHIAGIKKYKEKTGLGIFVVPINNKGDKVILKDVIYGGEKPLVILSGIATDNWAATIFANFYLPKRFPGIDITLLIVQRSSIRDFEFQEESIESIATVLFNDKADINEYMDKYEKELNETFLNKINFQQTNSK